MLNPYLYLLVKNVQITVTVNIYMCVNDKSPVNVAFKPL